MRTRSEGLVCKRADYIRAKLLEEQESLTPEQEAELATIPDNEMVCYQTNKAGMISVLYTFKTPRRVATKSNKKESSKLFDTLLEEV